MRVWGEGEGEGKVVEQQIGALGNPCSPFSSSFSLLCIQRGFDKNPTLGSVVHKQTRYFTFFVFNTLFSKYERCVSSAERLQEPSKQCITSVLLIEVLDQDTNLEHFLGWPDSMIMPGSGILIPYPDPTICKIQKNVNCAAI